MHSCPDLLDALNYAFLLNLFNVPLIAMQRPGPTSRVRLLAKVSDL